VSVDIAAPGSDIFSSSVGDLGDLRDSVKVYSNYFNDNDPTWVG
jgi:hypothetical protein